MMTPGEEAKSLLETPLPEIITEEDKKLPTTIHVYDAQIALTEELLSGLRREREEKVARAVKVGCTVDDQFKIEAVETPGDRVADGNLLKSRFPDKFPEYIRRRTDDINSSSEEKRVKALGSVETDIKVGLADKVFGKDNVTSCSVRPVTVTYVVRGVS